MAHLLHKGYIHLLVLPNYLGANHSNIRVYEGTGHSNHHSGDDVFIKKL